MAPLVLTSAEETAALSKADAELAFAFERNDVAKSALALFVHSGIDNLTKFSAIAKDGEDLKKLMLDEFGYDEKSSLAERVKVTNIVICFDNAKARTSERNKLEGELGAKHITKPLSGSEHASMRQAWERRYWSLDEEWTPSRLYLERRLQDLEEGEYKAEALTAVLSKVEEDPDQLIPVWSAAGTLQLKKGSNSVDEPKNPEQLRRRLKILGIGLMMLGLRHTNKSFLQNLSPQVFEDYLTYLLSEHCYYMQGTSAEGFAINGPSWAQLLIYEFQVRRKAWLEVQSVGIEFGKALKEAWKDPSTKERYLITPIALSAAGAKRTWDEGAGKGSNKWQKGGSGKGAGKGGKGFGKGGKSGGKGGKGGKGGGKGAGGLVCASRTPDGKAICYSYNDFSYRCRDSRCRFEHVCGACFGKHPIYACRPGNRAETQGSGATPVQ